MIKKNIFFAVLACFIGSFSHLFLSFGLGLIILEERNSALEFAISQFSTPIFCFMLAPIINKCIHYFRLKATIILSLVANLIVSLLLATILSLNLNPSFLTFIITAFLGLNGIFSYSFSIAYTISCKYIVPEKEITKLKSLEEIVGSCALIISPLIASLVYNQFSSWQYVIISSLLDFLTIGIIFLITFHVDNLKQNNLNKTLPKIKFESTKLRFYAIVPAIMGFCFSSINIGIPFIQIHHMNLNPSEYGTIKVSWAIGMLVSGMLLSRQRNEAMLNRSILFLSLNPLLFSLIFLYSKNAYASMLAFNFLFSYCLVRYRVALSTTTLKAFDDDGLNRIILHQKNFDQLFRATGIVIFGLLYDNFSYTSVLGLTGIVMLTITFYYSIKRE